MVDDSRYSALDRRGWLGLGLTANGLYDVLKSVITLFVPTVGGEGKRLDVLFKPTGGTVTIPGTPSAYTQNAVIGTNFEIQNFGRLVGKTGIIYNLNLREILGASAYNGQAVTADSTTDKITLNAHTLVAGNKIKFGGTAPTGLTAGTTYFVRDVEANAFKVAASYGGVAIDITANGTSVTITEVALQAPVDLYLSPVALANAADNARYAPSASEVEKLKYPCSFSTYKQAAAALSCMAKDDGYQRMFECESLSSSMYGVLVYNSSTGGVLSKNAYYSLSLMLMRD